MRAGSKSAINRWADKAFPPYRARLSMRRLKHFWLEMPAEYSRRRVGWATLLLPTRMPSVRGAESAVAFTTTLTSASNPSGVRRFRISNCCIQSLSKRLISRRNSDRLRFDPQFERADQQIFGLQFFARCGVVFDRRKRIGDQFFFQPFCILGNNHHR